MSRVPQLVIDAVHDRAAGHCEACGWALPGEGGVMHHRKLRGQGGRDEEINLMEVHPRCHNGHTNAIHSRVRRSIRLGHIVRFGEDPGEIPVTVLFTLLQVIA